MSERALTLVPPENPAPQGEPAPPVPADVTSLVAKAKGLTIKDAESKTVAKALLVDIKAAFKRLEGERDAQTRPLQDQLTRLRRLYEIPLTLLKQNETTLVHAIFAFEEKQRREAEKKQDEINRRHEEKVAVAEAKAIVEEKPMVLPPPPKVVPMPAKTEKVGEATLTIGAVKDFRIPNVAEDERLTRNDPRGKAIPDQYFILDRAAIGKLVRAGGGHLIPGIQVYDKPRASGRGVK